MLVKNFLEGSECAQVIDMTNQITAYKALEKLRQWTAINLSEKVFFEELKIKWFKKKQETASFNVEQQSEISMAAAIANLHLIDKPSDIFNQIKVYYSI